ncbi:hypothetical protein [Haloactinomyces albus]|nr:hypothetical protein [Haloactinomyces albus]
MTNRGRMEAERFALAVRTRTLPWLDHALGAHAAGPHASLAGVSRFRNTLTMPGGRETRKELFHAGMRGAIAAMSMSGMRAFTVHVGLLKSTPPETIVGEHGPEVLRELSVDARHVVVELLHWTYGAGGGAVFGSLPDAIRQRPWAGPIYGMLLWFGFQVILVRLLDLPQESRRSIRERTALVLDHALYGAILSELRRRPQR